MSARTRRAAGGATPDRPTSALMRVLSVVPDGAEGGGPLVFLDWTDDGTAPVPARHNRDAPVPAKDDEVLVVMVDLTPVIVCRTAGAPPID